MEVFMKKIKNFAQEKTILFSLAVCCISFLLLKGSGLLFSLFPGNTLWAFIDELFGILWPVALSILFGFCFIYNAKGFGSALKAGMAIFVFDIFVLVIKYLNAVLNIRPQWQTLPVILLGILSMIAIGVREEVLFRGIIGNSLLFKYGTDKKGLWFAIIVSSLFFGGVHITNIFKGVELIGLIAQILGAFTAGLFFTAVYLRSGNIWALILLHALEDSVGLFESTFTVTTVTKYDQVSNLNVGGTILMACVHICLALFLLRKSKQPAVFAHLEQLRNQTGWAEVPSCETEN